MSAVEDRPSLTNKADEYQGAGVLFPSDKIRVQVFGREDLSADYRLDESGNLTIPTIGIIAAEGLTTTSLAAEITQRLERDLKRSMYVSVEVRDTKPIYVTGYVSKPGAYKIASGSTVVQATALAGGALYGSIAPWLPAESLRESSRMRASEFELMGLLATRARLEADRSGALAVTIPAELTALAGEARAKELIDRQNELLDSQRRAMERQRKSFEAAAQEAKNEIAAYEKELANIETQRGLREAMLEPLKSLAQKGLTTQQRVNEAQLMLVSIDRDAQYAIANQARARQGLERAERDLALLELEHTKDIEKELQATEEMIEKTKSSIAGSAKVIRSLAGVPAEVLSQDQEPEFYYEIIRQAKDGSFSKQKATETTKLQPGDVLRVSIMRTGIEAVR